MEQGDSQPHEVIQTEGFTLWNYQGKHTVTTAILKFHLQSGIDAPISHTLHTQFYKVCMHTPHTAVMVTTIIWLFSVESVTHRRGHLADRGATLPRALGFICHPVQHSHIHRQTHTPDKQKAQTLSTRKISGKMSTVCLRTGCCVSLPSRLSHILSRQIQPLTLTGHRKCKNPP